MKTVLCLLAFVAVASTLSAQPRPGAFTTLVTTNTITDGGLLFVNGFGTSVFSAGGTGEQGIIMRNTTAGPTNRSIFRIGNNASTEITTLEAMSTTWTTIPGPYRFANGSLLGAFGGGGLSIATDNVLGAIRFYAGQGAESMRIFSSTGVSIGNTTDPGATNLSVTGTVRGAALSMPTTLFTNLTADVDGTMRWCSDCTHGTVPCTGAGTGSFAFRENATWACF